MLAHTEGPPSQHVTLADLDDAALVLVIPTEGARSSLWLGEPLPPANVAHALRVIADAVSPYPLPTDPAYPRGMGEDHRSAVSGRYVDDAEAEAHPDTTVTEHRDQPAANLGLATTQELIDELAARARVSAAAGESWPHYTTMKGH